MNTNIVFAFSIHKAGSTLFYNLLQRAMYRARELKIKNALRYVSIPDNLFNAGVPERALLQADFMSKHNQSFNESNTLYGGFRYVPAFATDEFLAGHRIMILVRDPRDVLTSLYFSLQRSHRIPEGEGGKVMMGLREKALAESIDEFVLWQVHQGIWAAKFSRLGELKDRAASWRYEDVVFDKARWLDEILSYLEVELPEACRREFVNAEDIRPERENADNHIRQVTPGDHMRKLKAETIEELNGIFSEALATWGYS